MITVDIALAMKLLEDKVHRSGDKVLAFKLMALYAQGFDFKAITREQLFKHLDERFNAGGAYYSLKELKNAGILTSARPIKFNKKIFKYEE